jgi:alkylation response protein AidB-like acyl-CoA dehydrogenase
MTQPNRNNPYSFNPFLEKLRSVDFYADDPFLQKTLRHYSGKNWNEVHEKLTRFSPKVSFQWRDLADHISRPELRPYLEHYDAHNNRVDRVVMPGEAKLLKEGVFSEGIFSEKTLDWENLAKRLVVNQIVDSSTMCPLACTEGLIALIEAFPNNRHPALDNILRHCKEGIDGDFGLGAQFVSEIQGGSDIPANVLEAEPEGDHYRIYGTKFFCSAVHADYTVITARMTGTEDLGTFIVPMWLPGDKEKEKRNGYRINRLKRKMGTAELPTAEIEFDGAVAYAVGPTDRGVANVVAIVLTLSRIFVGISSAGAMLRATREALIYSEFRDVFGRKMCEWPMAAKQVRDLIETAQRTTAGVFKVYDLYLNLGKKLQAGLDSDESLDVRKQRFDLRELIILQKLHTAFETVDVIRKAISLFGGHGVIEDFIILPKGLRDAMVNELWEGPRNVLLMQVFRDVHRVMSWYPPEEFVANILKGNPPELIHEFAEDLKSFLAKPPFFEFDLDSMEQTVEWDRFCARLFTAYQENALNEIGRAPILSLEKMSFPAIWIDESYSYKVALG